MFSRAIWTLFLRALIRKGIKKTRRSNFREARACVFPSDSFIYILQSARTSVRWFCEWQIVQWYEISHKVKDWCSVDFRWVNFCCVLFFLPPESWLNFHGRNPYTWIRISAIKILTDGPLLGSCLLSPRNTIWIPTNGYGYLHETPVHG